MGGGGCWVLRGMCICVYIGMRDRIGGLVVGIRIRIGMGRWEGEGGYDWGDRKDVEVW